MNLAPLEPVFRGTDSRGVVVRVENMWDACGISFLCPACWRANGGREGTHRITIWLVNAPPDLGGPGNAGRWTMTGTSVHDLTLDPSIDLKSGCTNGRDGKGWHGFVQGGKVRDA